MPNATTRTLALLLSLISAGHLLRAQTPAPPDRTEAPPKAIDDAKIDIVEHLDAKLPLDAVFTDHNGKTVRLRDYFDGKRPVILTLNYYRCPMLCGLTLNGMVDGLRELDWAAGDQFRIVTCSFDPMETERLAKVKRQNYLDYYARPEAAGDQGWAFLVGTKTNIDPLLETTGFKVAWNEKRQEWMHAAALILCTPDGRISRYLYGIQFEPKTLRLSLVEASEGKIGTTVDRVLLFCYHFDGEGYALHAMNLVRAGAVLTMLVVGGFLLYWWRREVRRARAQAAPALPTV